MTQPKTEAFLLEETARTALQDFMQNSAFMTRGAIVTDLDGTIVHEDKGKIWIPMNAEMALKELYELRRPVILNSLRFPLSVIRTFGRDWYNLSANPIPVVALNGSQTGYVTASKDGELIFEEIAAFPLLKEEIEEILVGVQGLLAAGVKDLLVFAYPRDWRIGEIIWTPVPEKLMTVKEKYLSASSVTAVEFAKWRQQLLQEEFCMIFLLINLPQDQLMAYQHTKRSNFFTHKGVDKLSGARSIATHLGVDLLHSVGAGDTEMDCFLSGTGLAVLVGNNELEFRGQLQTIKLKNSFELGSLLFQMVEMQRAL